MQSEKVARLFAILGGGCGVILSLMLWKGRGFSFAGVPFVLPWLWLCASIVCSFSAYLLWPTRKTRRVKAGQLALLTVSTGVVMGTVETGLRSFLQHTQGFNSIQQLYNPNPVGNLPTRSAHPLLVITQLSASNRIIYELQPGVENRFGHRDLRINAQGLREDVEYPIAKPEGRLRIVGLGDSGMWGWNVHQGEEYLSVLEERLSTNAAQQVDVINFAVPGYNCFQELETLRQKALPYDPDIVVVGWCDNDDQLPFFMYCRKNHWAKRGSYVYARALDRDTFLERISPEVLKLGDMDTDKIDPTVIAHSGWAGVEKCLRELSALSEENGFKLLLFGPMKKEVRGFCEDIGIPYYNTYEKIRKGDYPSSYCVHFMHPPKEGHAVLATHLELALREFGWVQ